MSVGNEGSAWSYTSFNAENHYCSTYLLFDVPRLDPGYAYRRAYGFQLRCLSE
ncbi:hypothetical protein [uncultured Rikenella sp.]|uniref:hypothetical protein n=1 Tax=uncultured Rikenella sp. TaxID=368003 RepID=UPI002612F65B|nr:hypothetical protein [uncultured Rikenella sp.]